MAGASPLPLTGVRVLDLGRMVAAPVATQLLGDLGAEVIKVERPGSGDDIRANGPVFLKDRDGADDDSPYFLAVNRNKQSVTVDITSTAGKQIVRELAAVSDVLVENFKAGDLARHGLDYASIRKVNPSLIYCSVTGFGQTGPYAQRPGLDSLFQAMSGLMSITGEPDGPPQKVGTVMSDFIGGMYAAVGILAALRHRDLNGGLGQQIDLALLDAQIAALLVPAQTYLVSGVVAQRHGSSTPNYQPGGLYHCGDGQILLTAGADAMFASLAGLLGMPELAEDPRFGSRPARSNHRDELTRVLEQVLGKHPRSYWLELFHANGIMCAPVNSIGEAFADEQVRHRKVAVSTAHLTAGEVKLIANPIRMSNAPDPPLVAPPRLGQHTDLVLSALLGRSALEIARLRSEGAI
ncbi:CaiB/BaiF CoA-transferase family protein [Phenylobacterium sp. SCN 70-31]|uniref:CaiB/BaiF CoA transferase family protein n=1 Tax=Phenylobacterium sp. SCN 70-31 TaxID=1660129 RepID=UPI00086DA5AE|nr:CaiB/BaiF CoA-transferase family protein [Phenylobacterium sp. SCN 70-31]ODT88308.1 MAG: CoA-transferase [Phenylobacterium sp. SCN 70-31]